MLQNRNMVCLECKFIIRKEIVIRYETIVLFIYLVIYVLERCYLFINLLLVELTKKKQQMISCLLWACSVINIC